MSLAAISLHQPWASCVAVGAKRYETRSWSTPHRGPIAIHAAKRWTLREQTAWANLRDVAGVPLPTEPPVAGEPVLLGGTFAPLGCVIALAELVSCEWMTEAMRQEQTATELLLGDWKPGRFAWRLEKVRPLRTPVPARGYQSVWRLSASQDAAVLAAAGVIERDADGLPVRMHL